MRPHMAHINNTLIKKRLADEAGKNGFSTKEIIEGEAATTLASAADLTEKANTKDIDKRYSLKRVPKSGKNKGKNPNTDPGLIPGLP